MSSESLAVEVDLNNLETFDYLSEGVQRATSVNVQENSEMIWRARPCQTRRQRPPWRFEPIVGASEVWLKKHDLWRAMIVDAVRYVTEG